MIIGHRDISSEKLEGSQSQNCHIWKFLAKFYVNCMFLTQGVFIMELSPYFVHGLIATEGIQQIY